MPDPLDLDALRVWLDQLSKSEDPSGIKPQTLRCLTVIKALQAALEPLLTLEQVDDEGFVTAEWNRAYCDGRAALALVMGGT